MGKLIAGAADKLFKGITWVKGSRLSGRACFQGKGISCLPLVRLGNVRQCERQRIAAVSFINNECYVRVFIAGNSKCAADQIKVVVFNPFPEKLVRN